MGTYAGTLEETFRPFDTTNECSNLYCNLCNNQGPVRGHFSEDHRMAARLEMPVGIFMETPR